MFERCKFFRNFTNFEDLFPNKTPNTNLDQTQMGCDTWNKEFNEFA